MVFPKAANVDAWLHDLNQIASGKPGAVHSVVRYRSQDVPENRIQY